MKLYSYFQKHIILFLLFFVFTISLKSQTLEFAFGEAGKNKKNLDAVLNHYRSLGDLQKYDAAVFLIKNLPIQEARKNIWVDRSENSISFSEFNYQDFNFAIEAFNKLRDSLSMKPKLVIEKDIKNISSQLLIDNIDIAFKSWRNNSWSKHYSFETFCEYILPYRSLIEPLEDWRSEYQFLVRDAKNHLDDEANPVEVCSKVMGELKGFSFLKGKSPIPTPLLSPQQLLFRREGNCPELANLALLSSRSMGVAVTFDFTPQYGASSNRHFWNTVIDNNGNHIPFNGSSANSGHSAPYIYSLDNKRLAKVYRNTYSIQSNALANLVSKNSIPSSFLKNKNIIDVTKEYVSVGTINFKDTQESTCSIAYLNVFNNLKWRIIDWAEKTRDGFKFKNLGRDLVYLPSFYLNRKTTYAEFPVLIKESGENRILKPNFNKTFDFHITRNKEFRTKYFENNTLRIESDELYTLLYWDQRWRKLGESIATTEGVFFKNIPSNALFLLLPSKPDSFERVFILDENTKSIIWY